MSNFTKLANLHRVFFKKAEGERLKVNPNDSGRIELPDPVLRYPPGLSEKLFPSKVPPKVPSKVPPKVPPGKATATPPQKRLFDNPNDPVPY